MSPCLSLSLKTPGVHVSCLPWYLPLETPCVYVFCFLSRPPLALPSSHPPLAVPDSNIGRAHVRLTSPTPRHTTYLCHAHVHDGPAAEEAVRAEVNRVFAVPPIDNALPHWAALLTPLQAPSAPPQAYFPPPPLLPPPMPPPPARTASSSHLIPHMQPPTPSGGAAQQPASSRHTGPSGPSPRPASLRGLSRQNPARQPSWVTMLAFLCKSSLPAARALPPTHRTWECHSPTSPSTMHVQASCQYPLVQYLHQIL